MIKVKTSDFLNILKKVKHAVDPKERVELANMFIFQDDIVYAYNDEFAVIHPLPMKTGIVGGVRAKEFINFIGKVRDPEIKISVQKPQDSKSYASMLIEGGNFESKFVLYETDFLLKEIKIPDKWYDLPDNFLSALKTVTLAVSKNLSTPIFACVHWKNNILEATDNFRLVQYKLQGDYPFDVSIFGDIISKVLNYEVLQVAPSDNFLMFKTGNGIILAARLYTGDYPDLEQIKSRFAEKMQDGVTITFSDGFIDAVERAEVLAAADELGDKYIDLKIAGKNVEIVSASEIGSYKEMLAIDTEVKPVSFSARADLFKDVLKLTKEAVLSKDLDALSFETDELYHLVLLG